MPPAFEGAKLSVTKMLSSHFQVTHSITFSSAATSGYKFGANYVGTQLYSQSEVILFFFINHFKEIFVFIRYFRLY
jgi:hypothetical protein